MQWLRTIFFNLTSNLSLTGIIIVTIGVPNFVKAQSLNTDLTGKYGPYFDALGINLKQSENFDWLVQTATNKLKNSEELQRGKGGADSGGGSILTRNDQTGLLDLFLKNQSAFLSKEEGYHLPRTRSFNQFGFEKLNNNDNSLYVNLISHIKKWEVNSPVIAEMVLRGLHNLPIYYMNYALAPTSPERPSTDSSDLTLAAIYIRGVGVMMPLRQFEKLSLKNQMGLIIHEALRHIQITYDYQLSDSYIQALTARLVDEPLKNDSLDHEGFIQGKILDIHLSPLLLTVGTGKIVKELCEFVNILKRVDDQIVLPTNESCQLSSNEIAEILKNKSYQNLRNKIRTISRLVSDAYYNMPASAKTDSLGERDRKLFLEASFILDSIITFQVGRILDSGSDDLLTFSKVSSIDVFIEDINKYGWFSKYHSSALQFRNELFKRNFITPN